MLPTKLFASHLSVVDSLNKQKQTFLHINAVVVMSKHVEQDDV